MEIFFDREKELDGLIHEIKKYNSLIVLYGNRRVGKTELIKEYLHDYVYNDYIYNLYSKDL